jgi:hypothetical protein
MLRGEAPEGGFRLLSAGRTIIPGSAGRMPMQAGWTDSTPEHPIEMHLLEAARLVIQAARCVGLC